MSAQPYSTDSARTVVLPPWAEDPYSPARLEQERRRDNDRRMQPACHAREITQQDELMHGALRRERRIRRLTAILETAAGSGDSQAAGTLLIVSYLADIRDRLDDLSDQARAAALR